MTSRESDAPTGDRLDAALRAQGAAHRDEYIDDDGFTARVIEALPPPVALPAWRKPVVAALWTVGSTGAAMAFPGVLTDLAREMLRLLGAHPISLPGIATAIAALAVATWAGAAYTLRRN